MKPNDGGENELFRHNPLGKIEQVSENDIIQKVIEADPSIVRKVSDGQSETMSARLRKFVCETTLPNSQFEIACDLSNGFLNNMGDRITTRSISRITSAFPYIRLTWLLTGEGDMINREAMERYCMLMHKETRDGQSTPKQSAILHATQALCKKFEKAEKTEDMRERTNDFLQKAYSLLAFSSSQEQEQHPEQEWELLPVFDINQLSTPERRKACWAGKIRPQGFINGSQYPKCDYAVRKDNKTYGVAKILKDATETSQAMERDNLEVQKMLKAGQKYFLCTLPSIGTIELCDVYEYTGTTPREITHITHTAPCAIEAGYYPLINHAAVSHNFPTFVTLDAGNDASNNTLFVDEDNITHLALVRFCLTLEVY